MVAQGAARGARHGGTFVFCFTFIPASLIIGLCICYLDFIFLNQFGARCRDIPGHNMFYMCKLLSFANQPNVSNTRRCYDVYVLSDNTKKPNELLRSKNTSIYSPAANRLFAVSNEVFSHIISRGLQGSESEGLNQRIQLLSSECAIRYTWELGGHQAQSAALS